MAFEGLKNAILDGLSNEIYQALKDGFIKVNDLEFHRAEHALAYLKYASLMNIDFPNDFHSYLLIPIIIRFLEKERIPSKKAIEVIIKAIIEEGEGCGIEIAKNPQVFIPVIQEFSLLENEEFKKIFKKGINSIKDKASLCTYWKDNLLIHYPDILKELGIEGKKGGQTQIPLYKKAILENNIAYWERSHKSPQSIDEIEFLELKDKWLQCDKKILLKIFFVPAFYKYVNPQQQAQAIEKCESLLDSEVSKKIFTHSFRKIYPYLSAETCLKILRWALWSPWVDLEIRISKEEFKEIIRFLILRLPNEKACIDLFKSFKLLELVDNTKRTRGGFKYMNSLSTFLETFHPWYEKLAILYDDYLTLKSQRMKKAFLNAIGTLVKIKFIE